MADGVGKGFCGNPESVRQLGDACGRTASELARLKARLQQTVDETIAAQKWCGPASETFMSKVQRLLDSLNGTRSNCEQMKDTLHTSAGLLAEAKAHLELAETLALQNGLRVGDDLIVAPIPGHPHPNLAAQPGIQQMVYQARTWAENAHRMIGRMDSVLAEALRAQAEEMANQAVNLSPIAKSAGTAVASIRAGRRLLRGRGPLGELAEQIRNAPRRRIGGVQPPPLGVDGKLTTDAGNIMHDRVWDVVKQRYPNVQFENIPPSQVKGPDMRVTGRTPGTPDPGFDWIEIKPNDGTDPFAYNQWGQPGWQGRGRMVTYDNMGNVYELDFPHPF